jgi:hypothetical protein
VNVALHAIADESSHGDTAVLDFSMTEESDGLFIAQGPQRVGCEHERIIELDDGVQVLCQCLKVGLEFQKAKEEDRKKHNISQGRPRAVLPSNIALHTFVSEREVETGLVLDGAKAAAEPTRAKSVAAFMVDDDIVLTQINE